MTVAEPQQRFTHAAYNRGDHNPELAIVLNSLRTILLLGMLALIGAVTLGAESRLNVFATPDHYLYAAKFAPASALVFVIALATYLAALFRPDIYFAQERSAGLLRRFGAFMIDFTLCVVLATTPTTLIALGFESLATGRFSLEVERDYRMAHDSLALPLILASMAAALVLFSLPLSRGRRTAGTVICGYAIQSYERIGLAGACGRTFLGFIALCGMILSVPMALRRADKRMWHDLAFDTRAVLAVTSVSASAAPKGIR